VSAAIVATTADDATTSANNEDPIHSFLVAHGLESLSLTTAWRWMRLLGFQYDTRKKSFYVDGHKREDVVENRNKFCRHYLTEFEPYCRRWIQLSKEEASAIKGLDVQLGYHYKDIILGTSNIEFHVDYWNQFSETAAGPTREATMSIRVSSQAKSIMIIGQDKSVFAQYLLGSKTWVGPKGQRPLLPKSEGEGYMLSAFVSKSWDLDKL
jgi:hypothetical protein